MVRGNFKGDQAKVNVNIKPIDEWSGVTTMSSTHTTGHGLEIALNVATRAIILISGHFVLDG